MREKILTLLVPPFLRKLDRYLLLNYPRYWAMKFHYIIFYGLLFNLLAGLFALFLFNPNRLQDFSGTPIWIILSIEAIVLLLWLYLQSFTSVEKQYGNTSYQVGLIETMIYAICIVLIFSPALVMLRAGISKVVSIYSYEKNVCDGPRVLDFYPKNKLSDLDPNLNRLQKALQLVQNTTNLGVIKAENVGIETAIVVPEVTKKEEAIYSTGTNYKNELYFMAFDGNEKKIVEDGTAILEISGNGGIKVTTKNSGMTPDKGNLVTTIKAGRITLNIGDEISMINSYSRFDEHNNTSWAKSIDSFPLARSGAKVISGRVQLQSFYTYPIGNNQALILSKGQDIELVTGEAVIVAESPIVSVILDYKSYNYCKVIANPSNDMARDAFFNFFQIEFWYLVFIIIGICFMQISKHSNWFTLIFSVFYLAILFLILYSFIYSFIFSFTDVFFPLGTASNFYLHSVKDWLTNNKLINISTNFFLLTSGIVFFMLVQLARLIRSKKYKLFAFINFVNMPILFGIFGFITIWRFLLPVITSPEIVDFYIQPIVLIYLICFFIIYLLYTPIQKKILIYLISLPRD